MPHPTLTRPDAVRRSRRRRATTLLVVGVLLIGLAPPVAADDLDHRRRAVEDRAAATQQRSEELQASIEGLSTSLASAVADLGATQARLPAAQEQLRLARDELGAATRQATTLQTRLADAATQQATLRDQIAALGARQARVRASVGQLARQAQRTAPDMSALAVALDAQTLRDFTEGLQTTNTAQRIQTRLLDELATTGAEASNAQARLGAVADTIAALKTQADAEVVRADQARADAAARKAEIDDLITQQQATRQRLTELKTQAEAEQAENDRQRAALEEELAAIIAEQQRAAAASSGGQGAPPPSWASGAIFANPTSINPMYVTSSYGMRMHPILGYQRLHAGIDLRTYCNTPLYAPRDATVQWAQWRNGFGNQVMLNYGTVNGRSLMSSSNHMTRFTVSTGQRVRQGDLIGYSGNTGLSTACHLHFEVYQDGSTIDPAPLLVK